MLDLYSRFNVLFVISMSYFVEVDWSEVKSCTSSFVISYWKDIHKSNIEKPNENLVENVGTMV